MFTADVKRALKPKREITKTINRHHKEITRPNERAALSHKAATLNCVITPKILLSNLFEFHYSDFK